VKHLITLAVVIGAIATAVLPAPSAGVRYVTVVNLLSAPATAVLHQYGQVGTKTIPSRYDHTFDIPPGSTSITVTSGACSGEKRLSLPTQERVRVVINAGCALSIQ
jgi:hypothetical protein